MQKNAFNTTKAITLTVVSIGLVIAYPFINYSLQLHQYGELLPIVLALVIGWRALNSVINIQRYSLMSISILLLAGSVWMSNVTSQLIPVIIYMLLIWFFSRTLIHPPSLIERFARLQFAEIPDEVLNYCRQLTLVWVILFVVVMLLSLLLIITDDAWYLALLHGVIAPVLMAFLMLIEHVYRLKRFPFMKDQIPSIKATVQSAIKNKDQLW